MHNSPYFFSSFFLILVFQLFKNYIKIAQQSLRIINLFTISNNKNLEINEIQSKTFKLSRFLIFRKIVNYICACVIQSIIK